MNSSLTIAGIHVDCPYRAYPSQIAMMDRIIKALQRSQSCLLESPTGSGKSIALLCATLAWQSAEKERLVKEAASSPVRNVPLPPNTDPETPATQNCLLVKDKDDEEFTDECLMKRVKSEAKTSACNSRAVNDYSNVQSDEEDHLAECRSATIRVKKPPKIYFGTRTNKQIKQLIREFRKTSYAANVKMAIMSGREQTCIHNKVSTMSSKNDACRDCINGKDGKSCQYYNNLKRKYESPVQLRSLLHKQNSSVFDIEDIVSLGRSHTSFDIKFCPYFATTRTLVQDADIIFCPYNYLIDPMIRESLAIKMKDQVVIFDEAHNIEDACRDSSSFDLTDLEIQETCEDLSKLIHLEIKLEHTKPLYQAISSLRDWMGEEIRSDRLKKHDYGVECEILTGPECAAAMKELQLDPGEVDTLKNHMKELTDDEDVSGNEKSKQKKPLTLSPLSSVTLEKLLTALQYLYVDKCKFIDDYKLCLRKELNTNDKKPEKKVGWHQPGRRGSLKEQFTVTLSFWSMNPTVAFSTLGKVAKTVIVASGTLSPLVTFQSELGHNFQFQLEAAHVLPLDRVFVAAVGKGPNNVPLKATYQHTEELPFQDELGQLLLDVSSVIPGGILCFFPSYSLMDKMHKRWMTTGQINHISRKKLVVLEPRSGDKLTEKLQSFFQAVAQPQSIGPECSGAILLAICRGKVSEGIDFADDHARAVITIGIPFPSIKDLQVDLKKKFNDEAVRNKKSTLTGGRWYETQAFRALNQALGRCIRHVKDWGSLILVDERFQSKNSSASLSKWIRERVQRFEQFGDMMFSLREFNERMVLSESQSTGIPSVADFSNGSGKDIVPTSGAGVCVSNGFGEKTFPIPNEVKAKGPKLIENGLSTGHLSKAINRCEHSDDNSGGLEEESLEATVSSSAVETMSERVALSVVTPTEPLKIEQFNEDSPHKARHSHTGLERVRSGGDLNSSLNGRFAQMGLESPVANSKRPSVDETNKQSWKRVKNKCCSQQIVCANCGNSLIYDEEMSLTNFTTVKREKLPQQTFSLADSCECLSETTWSYAVLVANSALVNVECFSSIEHPLFPLHCCYDRDSGIVSQYVFCKNCLKESGCPMLEFLIGYQIIHSGELKLDHRNKMVLLAQGAKLCLQPFASGQSL